MRWASILESSIGDLLGHCGLTHSLAFAAAINRRRAKKTSLPCFRKTALPESAVRDVTAISGAVFSCVHHCGLKPKRCGRSELLGTSAPGEAAKRYRYLLLHYG